MLCSPQNMRVFILLRIVPNIKIGFLSFFCNWVKTLYSTTIGTPAPQHWSPCFWSLELFGIFSLKILPLETRCAFFCLLIRTKMCPFGLLISVSRILMWGKAGLPLLAVFVHGGMARGVDVQTLFCNVRCSHQAALASTSHLLTSVKMMSAAW